MIAIASAAESSARSSTCVSTKLSRQISPFKTDRSALVGSWCEELAQANRQFSDTPAGPRAYNEDVKNALLSIGLLAICGFTFVVATRTSAPTLAAQGNSSAAQSSYLENCSGCHGTRGEGDALIAPPLAGNPYVTGDSKKLIQTMLIGMIGPVKERGATWNGSMPPWRGILSDAELAGLITYIRTEWGNRAAPVTRAQVAAEANASSVTNAAARIGAAPGTGEVEEVYMTNCSGCHGVSGQGAVGPPLAHNPRVTGNANTVIAVVLDGGVGPVKEGGVTWNGAMPPWRGMLTNQDLAAVITYIRRSWGNNASAVHENQIAGK